jgi:hypothetical protein
MPRSITPAVVAPRPLVRSALLVVAFLAATPDLLMAQKPRLQREVESENGRFRLRIEPGRSGRGRGTACTAALMGRDARNGGRVWERPLVNPVAPLLTAVRDDGQFVVTLGEFPYGGVQNALVVYGDNGQLLRHFLLTDLLGRDDWPHVKRDRRRVEWLRDAEYGFEEPDLFVVRLKWEREIRIDLLTLKLIDGPPPGEIPEDVLALLASEERHGVGFEADEADVEALLAEEEALRRFAEIQAADPGVDQQAMLMALLEQAMAQAQIEADPEVAAQLKAAIQAQLDAMLAARGGKTQTAEAAVEFQSAEEGIGHLKALGYLGDDSALQVREMPDIEAIIKSLEDVEPIAIRGTREEVEAQLIEHLGEERARPIIDGMAGGLDHFRVPGEDQFDLSLKTAGDVVQLSSAPLLPGQASMTMMSIQAPQPGELEMSAMNWNDLGSSEDSSGAELFFDPPQPPQTLAGRILGADPPQPNVAEKTDYVSWYNSFAATEGPSAAPLYQAAADNYVDFAGGDELLTRALAGDAEALGSPEVGQWIEQNQLALADFREANHYEYNGMAAESEKGDMIGILLPYLGKYRGLTRALVADGRRMLLDGDVDGAMDAYVDAVTAGRQTGRGRTLIDSLVGTAMQAAGNEALLDAMATSGESIDYAALADKLEAAAVVRPRPLAELMQFERSMYMDATQRMFEIDPETNTPVVTPESLRRYNILDYTGEGGADPMKTMGLLNLDFHETTEVGNAYYDAITESMQQPYPEARASMEAVEQQLERDTHPMIRTLLPALGRSNFITTRGETARRGTLLLTRIKAYEQQFGAPPESLDAFGGATYALDPFTNAPFRYERTPDGFRLYSAGGDGIDDGGIHDERGEQNDYVLWPRPAKRQP